MFNAFDHFREGGWGMFPTLVFGLLLLSVAVRYATTPEKRFVPLLVALNGLTLSSGALGFVTGVITTAGAVARLGSSAPSVIPFLGLGESLNNLAVALIFVALGFVAITWGAWQTARAAEPSLSEA